MNTTIDVRRAASRFRTRTAWLDSYHSFSFGGHHDPDNTGHGLLLVSNDDRVQPNTGFGTHARRDMEIVTWLLTGQLEHRDSEGNHGLLYPGLAQRMSAGTGIEHSEHNLSATEDAHFIQMWVPPDAKDPSPSYEQRDINDELAKGGLQPIASGQGHTGAVRLHQRDAVLWGGRLHPGEHVALPDGPHAHVFLAVAPRASDRTSRSPRATPPVSPTPPASSSPQGTAAPRSSSGSPRSPTCTPPDHAFRGIRPNPAGTDDRHVTSDHTPE